MKVIARCYNCRQEICFDNNTRNRNGWQFQSMIMLIFTFADIKIEKVAFRIKNVLDVDKSYTLMKITGQFRESIFHWIGIRGNLMSVTTLTFPDRQFSKNYPLL